MAVLAAITAPLVLLFHRIERRGKVRLPSVGHAAAAIAGSVASAVGLGLLAFHGFYRPDGFMALAVVPLALLVSGADLLGQVRLVPTRR